jgi:hypothetical protein
MSSDMIEILMNIHHRMARDASRKFKNVGHFWGMGKLNKFGKNRGDTLSC